MLDGTGQRAENRSTSGKVILIVEDNEAHATMLAQMLIETPYQVAVATDGFAALKIIRHITPHLLILDCRLPEMNGIQLYDHLHANRTLEAIPAIIISANLDPYKDDIETRKLLGLSKPFDLDELLEIIQKVLA